MKSARILAALSLAAIGGGVFLLGGIGHALVAVGSLLWLDLTLAGLRRKAGKP